MTFQIFRLLLASTSANQVQEQSKEWPADGTLHKKFADRSSKSNEPNYGRFWLGESQIVSIPLTYDDAG